MTACSPRKRPWNAGRVSRRLTTTWPPLTSRWVVGTKESKPPGRRFRASPTTRPRRAIWLGAYPTRLRPGSRVPLFAGAPSLARPSRNFRRIAIRVGGKLTRQGEATTVRESYTVYPTYIGLTAAFSPARKCKRPHTQKLVPNQTIPLFFSTRIMVQFYVCLDRISSSLSRLKYRCPKSMRVTFVVD